jgi:hypothetical protein
MLQNSILSVEKSEAFAVQVISTAHLERALVEDRKTLRELDERQKCASCGINSTCRLGSENSKH